MNGPAVNEPVVEAGPTDAGPAAVYCGACGAVASGVAHERCLGRLELEPPRFCAHCARRMVVQVTPTGWTARCSRHGEIRDRAAG